MRNISKPAITFARTLRKEMSDSERILWAEIRYKKHQFKFRRQYSIGPYVLDFFCPEARICIEVDGEHHAERQDQDKARDDWLASKGIQTIRIPSWDVYDYLDAVVERIMETCVERTLEPPPALG